MFPRSGFGRDLLDVLLTPPFTSKGFGLGDVRSAAATEKCGSVSPRRTTTGPRHTFEIASKAGELVFVSETANNLEEAIFEAVEKQVSLEHADVRGLLVLDVKSPQYRIIVAGERLKIGKRVASINGWFATYEDFLSNEGLSPELMIRFGADLRHIANLLAIDKAGKTSKQ